MKIAGKKTEFCISLASIYAGQVLKFGFCCWKVFVLNGRKLLSVNSVISVRPAI